MHSQIVDLVSAYYHSTVVVDALLTSTGRVPITNGLDLGATGVDYDPHRGVQVDDFPRTRNRRIYAVATSAFRTRSTIPRTPRRASR
jgi:pyruvate/2-oxoglutarate dehydrogenase complex dihydrolipoamide dehydrogenase (E3) component